MPKGERLSALVLYVAFIMFECMRELPEFEGERPPFAPDDRDRSVARKVEIYLAYGIRTYHAGDTFAHGKVPGFSFDVTACFARGHTLRDPCVRARTHRGRYLRPVMCIDAHVVAGEITTPGGRGRLPDPEIETDVHRCIFEFAVAFGFG